MIEVTEHDSATSCWWEAAAASRDPGLLGYHHPAYQDVLNSVLGDAGRVLLATEAQGQIVGCLPFRLRAGRFGTVLNAMPFFGTNGVAAARHPEGRKALLQAYAQRSRAPDVLASAFYTPFLADPALFGATLPVHQRLTKFTHFLDLAAGGAWPVKRRGDLRRAQAAGLAVRDARAGDLDDLWSIYETAALADGIPVKPHSWVAATLGLSERDGADGTVQWIVAEHEGKVIAGLLTMAGPQTCSYTLPVARPDRRAMQPIAFLIDAAVQRARARGLRYFNFESSPAWQDPVFKFKERWGASLSKYDLILFYPRGEAAVAAIPAAELRSEYPFYFVRPWGQVGGLLPETAVEACVGEAALPDEVAIQ